MSTSRNLWTLAASTAMAVVLAGSLPMAAAGAELLTETPRVVVTVPGVISQAQLQRQLELLGYGNIKLSPIYPTPSNPHPELSATMTSDPAFTPVHRGWNGSAMKEGRTLNVRVEFGSAPSVAELPSD